MKVIATEIPNVLIFEPQVFSDERGFFMGSFNQKDFEAAIGHAVSFVQDNHSKSMKNVLRGLHYQLPPKEQGKLVRVVQGEVFDVAVDIRRNSPTFGRWTGINLSAENKLQLWIPAGFAHGFLAVSDTAEFFYKTTGYYSPENQQCIAWDDPDISVNWPLDGDPVLSDRDRQGSRLSFAEVFE